MQPADQYRKCIEEYQLNKKTLSARYARYGYLRLVVFILLFVFLILIWQWNPIIGLVWFILGLAGFGRLVKWHETLKSKAEHWQRLVIVNQHELRFLDHDYRWNDNGIDLEPASHDYTSDLDIFGEASLFSYTSRAKTLRGRRKLSKWLCDPADATEIKSRQEAVHELSGMIEFRQNLSALSMNLQEADSDHQNLHKWLQKKPYMMGRRLPRLMKWLVIPTILPSCLLMMYFGYFRFSWLPLLIPAYFLWRSKKHIDEIHELTEQISDTLVIYAALFKHMESSQWLSPWLAKVYAQMSKKDVVPSVWISKLGYGIKQLNVRRNFFALLFNLFALWDFHWVEKIEKIKLQIGDSIHLWFDALADIEAISSLANLAHNNPDWTIPTLADNTIDARELGHPLIPALNRVSNDLSLSIRSDLKLITGSNMAGKSTFLRTLGVNLVLAGAGAPVCATRFTFTPVKVFTSMRTVDALHENASTFYAELKRLRMMLDKIQRHSYIVLLDEILKGTNSGDRHKGSEALIKQLIRCQASGLIATHDLQLTDLAHEFPSQIENWYFDVVIKNDELHFDYKLKKGVCQSFNATILMKKMGIDVELDNTL